eukprot:SAG31_NODE_7521_length_1666_cov_1.456924_3_plen_142_part_01
MIVLPEGQVIAARRTLEQELAALPDPGPVAGYAKGDPLVRAWHRLAVCLQLIADTAEKWGTPRATRTKWYCSLAQPCYALLTLISGNLKPPNCLRREDQIKKQLNVHEADKEARSERCFLRPESKFRVTWDVMQVLLLVYVM